MTDDPVQSVGCDLVDVARFRALLRRRPGALAWLFTDDERRDAVRDGVSLDDDVAVRRLAARWAAKEALAKAWDRPDLAWTDVAVVSTPGGAPRVHVAGRPVPGVHVSLAHEHGHALAFVVATCAPPAPPRRTDAAVPQEQPCC